MSNDIIEQDIIAPAEGKGWVERARIDRCTRSVVLQLPRVVVRLTDGRALIVTQACLEAAGIPIRGQ